MVTWLKGALRTLVYHYCRLGPVQRGKDRLVSTTLPLLEPDKKPVPIVGGARMVADISDDLQRRIYFFGCHEPETTQLIFGILRPGDTFIDLGANIGYYTVIAGSLVGPAGAVHSFEPIPEIFSSLKENVALNALTNVRLNQNAVFNEDCELEIFLPKPENNGTGSFMRSPDAPGESILCDALTLDAYVEREGIEQIRLIKMDIEGAELRALKGMKNLLSSSTRPDVICEASPNWFSAGGHTRAHIIGYMDSFGYRCREISLSGLTEVQENQTKTSNLLFTTRDI